MHAPANSHVTIDENGVARIDGSRLKVRHVIEAWITTGKSPDKVLEAYPFLTLAHVYAALAHYYDNQAAYDAEIERVLREADAMRAAASESPLKTKLRDLGLSRG